MSVPLFSSVSWFLTNSFVSSSHLFVGLPALLRVLVVVIRPGFHSAALLVHLSSLCAASLVAERRLNFLGASGVCDFTILWAMRRVAQRKVGADHRWKVCGGRSRPGWAPQCAGTERVQTESCRLTNTLVPDRQSRYAGSGPSVPWHPPPPGGGENGNGQRQQPKKQGTTASVASPQRFEAQQSFYLRGATPKRTVQSKCHQHKTTKGFTHRHVLK